jgi:hypothetical protein
LYPSVLLCLLHSTSRFSNSFIENESRIVAYLANSALIFHVVELFIIERSSIKREPNHRRRFLLLVTTAFVAIFVIRASVEGSVLYKSNISKVLPPSVIVLPFAFLGCFNISVSALFKTVSNITVKKTDSTDNFRGRSCCEFIFAIIMACIASLSWLLVFLFWAEEWGNASTTINGDTITHFDRIALFIVHSILKDPRQMLPQLVYALCITQCVIYFFLPGYEADSLNPNTFAHILSSKCFRFSMCLIGMLPVWTIVLGPSGFLSSITIVVLSAALTLIAVNSTIMSSYTDDRRECRNVQRMHAISCIALWRLFGRHIFFASGHSNKFSDLQCVSLA